MTILAVHRRPPNWPADPDRPIHPFGNLFVETDGAAPTRAEVDAILAPPPRPIELATALIQKRIELEGGWDTYVNYMFGAPARRNAFVKTMFLGNLKLNDNSFVASLQGAGFTADQITRITAPPPVEPRLN